jgi:hypothetical protein
MFTEQDWLELAGRILRATSTGKLHWEKSDVGGSISPTYVCRLGRSTEYRIWARDRDDRFPFIFEIFKNENDSWQSVKVDGFETDSFEDGSRSASELVTELYPLAARDATGASKVLADLLDELEQVDPEAPF